MITAELIMLEERALLSLRLISREQVQKEIDAKALSGLKRAASVDRQQAENEGRLHSKVS